SGSIPTGRRGETLLQKCKLQRDRKSTRLNSSHMSISYAVFCLKKKNNVSNPPTPAQTERCAIKWVSRSRWKSPFLLFFFNDTATTEIYTLSLHDALPI